MILNHNQTGLRLGPGVRGWCQAQASSLMALGHGLGLQLAIICLLVSMRKITFSRLSARKLTSPSPSSKFLKDKGLSLKFYGSPSITFTRDEFVCMVQIPALK